MEKIISEEINKIIEEQLPERVGNLLKTRLVEADKDKELLTINESAMADLKKNMDEMEEVAILAGKEITELEKKLELAGKLTEREKEVRERETTQEVKMLKHQLSCAKNSNEKVIGFIDSLMRNTVFRENTFKNTAEQYNSNNGAYDKVETGESTDKQRNKFAGEWVTLAGCPDGNESLTAETNSVDQETAKPAVSILSTPRQLLC